MRPLWHCGLCVIVDRCGASSVEVEAELEQRHRGWLARHTQRALR